MAHFHLWGRVEQVATARFLVVVTAVQANSPPSAQRYTRLAATREVARERRDALLEEIKGRLAGDGHDVIDIQVD